MKAKPITGKIRKVNLKPQKSRALIRKFHVLLKRKQQIEATGKGTAELAGIDEQINALGGLQMYQQASISGQDKARGGDSSKLLVSWLQELPKVQRTLLEIGCLQYDNCCARSKLFSCIDRIDLNSQDPRILQQDFMKRPLPQSEKERYSVLSLSLVVNYVPDALVRGDMLKRTRDFLLPEGLMFFVLPEPCIYNSRYFNLESMHQIFDALGFRILKEHRTRKLVYWLLELTNVPGPIGPLRKKLLQDVAGKNNFCIALR